MITKFKQKEYSLLKNENFLKLGEEISFTATNTMFEDVKLEKFNQLTVISVFPSLNTRVCDEQTKEISKLASEFEDVRFISISLDLPSAIAEWKSVNMLPNIEIYSDYKRREFGLKYGFLIDEIFLLDRGFIVINDQNKVIDFSYNENVHDQISFEKIKSIILDNKK
ncbi:redoxin domain-containing protein [Mesomycoplasma molare]|uniref:Redoxin domain-containing protein n=1 Tax=Mesomycoplasma molare TaxID=171288 RepID=A0ABY5TY25_9BACT|nr:redoxin domain-containing protein [Mesomycoplasma molare]UWD33939.1 redoxin domain-containing protein [Mesomycoplasma molare]